MANSTPNPEDFVPLDLCPLLPLQRLYFNRDYSSFTARLCTQRKLAQVKNDLYRPKHFLFSFSWPPLEPVKHHVTGLSSVKRLPIEKGCSMISRAIGLMILLN